MKQLWSRDDAHQDGSVYQMHVKGGFYLEDYIAQGGSKTDAELISFITSHITKGLIPMKISESNIACSSFTAQTPDGDRIFARNYDFSKHMKADIVESIFRVFLVQLTKNKMTVK